MLNTVGLNVVWGGGEAAGWSRRRRNLNFGMGSTNGSAREDEMYLPLAMPGMSVGVGWYLHCLVCSRGGLISERKNTTDSTLFPTIFQNMFSRKFVIQIITNAHTHTRVLSMEL